MVQPRPGPGCYVYGPWVPVGGGNLYPSWWVLYERRRAPRITQIAYFFGKLLWSTSESSTSRTLVNKGKKTKATVDAPT